MIVYRYEFRGVGPYRTAEKDKTIQALRDEISGAHCCITHPDIERDTNWKFNFEYVCGCPSRSSLANWFNRYNKRLKAAGFRIHVYETEDYIEGTSGKQLAFRKDTAKLVQVLK